MRQCQISRQRGYSQEERIDHQLVRGIGIPALTANIVSSTIGAFEMGGKRSLGVLLDSLIPACPQYPVASGRRNPFKLYDFPLVTLMSLLY